MKAAIVQYPPVFLDLERTLEHAVQHIEEAAGLGAELVVFPEAWFPGYPMWIQRTRPEGEEDVVHVLIARLQDNAVDLASDGLAPVRRAAREHGVVVVAAHQEIDRAHSGTIFNSVAIIDADGTILNNHRKVMPTFPERMVWGFGDASTIRVVETAVGRVGALLCWENLMPLARYALYAQMPEIYVAPTADEGDGWQATMQHIARESCAYVLGGSTSWRTADLPADVPFRDRLVDDEEEWISPGDAVVYEPFGSAVAGPMHRGRGLLVAEIDIEKCRLPRVWFDVTGHYARPDLFQLHVNTTPQSPVSFGA
ncbi:nitrilase [Agromyces rhizosphaerae]|uniref:Nitrilase n=1 Tax=Agromyces rhizosphaerae TaxID=88374 RepID=A0A9W6FPY3_9MICO|nr:carbon-nitrogen hydrolase family protein [Agromyces rhizosphaerae]GLI28514.1 nitrilase [Agromyces rhizosphaerae]